MGNTSTAKLEPLKNNRHISLKNQSIDSIILDNLTGISPNITIEGEIEIDISNILCPYMMSKHVKKLPNDSYKIYGTCSVTNNGCIYSNKNTNYPEACHIPEQNPTIDPSENIHYAKFCCGK